MDIFWTVRLHALWWLTTKHSRRIDGSGAVGGLERLSVHLIVLAMSVITTVVAGCQWASKLGVFGTRSADWKAELASPRRYHSGLWRSLGALALLLGRAAGVTVQAASPTECREFADQCDRFAKEAKTERHRIPLVMFCKHSLQSASHYFVEPRYEAARHEHCRR